MKFPSILILAAAWFPNGLSAQSGPEADEQFSHSVDTPQKPWTARPFRNDPNAFQFAIVTDRTGGMRPGVFPRAVAKVNELQPEFVITVGDLIPGGGSLRDEQEIRRQWAEFNGFIEGFEMPFFYLPGNHDVSNPVMDRIWDEQFGVRYYSFVYKDVLFLCLNTQDGEGSRPFLGGEQIAWAEAELARNAEVRWTLVFIHQPLWLSEEGWKGNRGSEDGSKRRSATGWPEIEAALAGRRHTVYAGHVHRYARYERNAANYYTLGTTGGGSRLRGASFGEFDHATWITMTDEGPRMMNLTLDGMLEEDTATEAHQKFWRGLNFSEEFRDTYPFVDRIVTLPLENLFDAPISGQLSWVLPATDHWTVSPRRVSVKLAPGEKQTVEFLLSHRGEASSFFPLPRLETRFHGDDARLDQSRALYLPLDLMEHAKKFPVTARLAQVEQGAKIDGRIDEALWQGAPTIAGLNLVKADGYPPVNTEAWLRHDGEMLYIAVRCEEPMTRDLISDVEVRDGEVRDDDSIEILLDTNLDRKSYYHFAVNAAGVIYDGRDGDSSWDSSATVVTMVEEGAWTVELAIPLSEIGKDAADRDAWGLQLARHWPRGEERRSYQWAPTFWYGNYVPSLFGRLELN